ncbi:MAG: hypothetical protein QXI60_03310 [Thermofilaceae archaeon]
MAEAGYTPVETPFVLRVRGRRARLVSLADVIPHNVKWILVEEVRTQGNVVILKLRLLV